MLRLLMSGWTCWFILFLSLGLSSCASEPTTVQQAVQNAVSRLTPSNSQLIMQPLIKLINGTPAVSLIFPQVSFLF